MAVMNTETAWISCKKMMLLFGSVIHSLDKYAYPFMLLGARFYIARVFWRSGQTKIPNIDSTVDLFKTEYIPNWAVNSKNLLGMDLSWTVPDPAIAAKLAIITELGLPVLLVLGLMGRFAALGLLGMTATIELLIYPGTTEHYYWMIILGLLITGGPGAISVDHLLRKKFLNDLCKLSSASDK